MGCSPSTIKNSKNWQDCTKGSDVCGNENCQDQWFCESFRCGPDDCSKEECKGQSVCTTEPPKPVSKPTEPPTPEPPKPQPPVAPLDQYEPSVGLCQHTTYLDTLRHIEDINKCAEHCATLKNCDAFSYRKTGNYCVLYQQSGATKITGNKSLKNITCYTKK